ncbi:porin [Vibrio salinus]|uniref:porin n=1 Tax=Vibrio salinus TaxID=2899784 RepID=UPI001E3C241D|nr:porin [Vibrio salinus]MCE0495805.1 porin [Vibrio salinus]
MMKKTFIALALASVTASTGVMAKTNVYKTDKASVDIYGSVRLIYESKESSIDGDNYVSDHLTLHDAGSRFGFKALRNLENGLYAKGQLETRLDGYDTGTRGTDNWGDFMIKRGWVGLGSSKYGEIRFGRQYTVIDSLRGASSHLTLSIVPLYLNKWGKEVTRYDYKYGKNWTFSANYNLSDARNGVTDSYDGQTCYEHYGCVDSEYVAGALYRHQGAAFNIAIGHKEMASDADNNQDGHENAIMLATSYTFENGLKLGFDAGFKHGEDSSYKGVGATATSSGSHTSYYQYDKADAFYVSPGISINLGNKENKIYGNYVYEKYDVSGSDDSLDSVKSNGVLAGISHDLEYRKIVVFFEGSYVEADQNFTGTTTDNTVKNKSINLGMRYYF